MDLSVYLGLIYFIGFLYPLSIAKYFPFFFFQNF